MISFFRREFHFRLRFPQGKGLMDTYWLECKDGGIARAAELDLPSFFEDVRPVFMRRLREEGTL